MAERPLRPGMRVEPADSPEEWDEYVSRAAEATFFHRFGWQRVLERTFPYRRRSLVARREGRICGVLPLHLVRTLPFGRSLVSTPFAVYGGICADDEEAREALLLQARALADSMRVDYLELRHRSAIAGLPAKELYVTFRRAIDPDPERNMAAIPRNQRRSIRIGIKGGLRSEMGREEVLDPWYRIYTESLRQFGTPAFPRRLFTGLLEEFGEDCGILGVYHEGRMVAGVLTFFFRDQVLPYYAGALRSAFPLACNDYMYWSLLCWAAERGYRLFDFGRSKLETGSYHYKRHWGFEPEPLAYQYYVARGRGLPDLNPMNPRYALAIRAWKRMPAGLARWLGPKVVRYFP